MIDLVTPKEAKREAAKGLKEAIAVSVKKFERFLLLTLKDVRNKRLFGVGNTCGLCWYDAINGEDDCGNCQLENFTGNCFEEGAVYRKWLNENIAIRLGKVTTITQFRKETRKMIKILKQLYKECK